MQEFVINVNNEIFTAKTLHSEIFFVIIIPQSRAQLCDDIIRERGATRMFESSFNFEAFAEFMGYFMDKLLKMVFQTKDWLEATAKKFE